MQLAQSIWKKTALAACAAALALGSLSARAETVYNLLSLSDFSGPFAAIMPSFGGAREAVVGWWNAEAGAKLGVKLVLKPYDTRYDAAQTASLWPGILAETKPVIGFALGGPDTAALQQRLPQDKVPLILGAAANGFAWRPNQWVLTVRPTYVHETAGFINWYHKTKLGGSRPAKVAMVTSEASPAYADMGKGLAAYAKANPKVAEVVEIIYAEPAPADLTLQVRRVVNAGADFIVCTASIQQAVAVKRALQALGKKTPVMLSMHNAPTFIAKQLGGIEAFEGDYEAQSGVITSSEDTEAKRFYDMLAAKYGLKASWNSVTGAGIAQSLVLVRAIEAAAQKHGGAKLTGEILYQTLTTTEFPAKLFFGYTHDLEFSVDAPFPSKAPKINIGTVSGGKVVTVATGVPVPTLSKW